MKLRDVLDPAHVVVPLKAATVQQATEQLADKLIESGAIADPKRLSGVIKNAWPEDMVSVGEHAFLPHFRTEAVRKLVTAVGVAATPIRWEKDPHRTARIVILIVAPPRETPTYLQVVGAFARTLSDPETVLQLLAAKTPEQVVGVGALEAIELPGQLTVRDVMTPHVYTVRPNQTLGEVARLMVAKDVRAVPVVEEDGGLVGIVTHKELLRHLVPEFVQRAKSGEFRAPTRSQIQRGSTDPTQIPVREVMARSVLCLSEDQTLSDVANLMTSKEVDRFPVVREGVVVGFLTRADLIRRLVAP
ncbi:MAG: CBS domain-containing protein [Gemmatimonadetes bacterium]|nr:CBS domain-containing protein [Gemmatimonadota bacterium]